MPAAVGHTKQGGCQAAGHRDNIFGRSVPCGPCRRLLEERRRDKGALEDQQDIQAKDAQALLDGLYLSGDMDRAHDDLFLAKKEFWTETARFLTLLGFVGIWIVPVFAMQLGLYPSMMVFGPVALVLPFIIIGLQYGKFSAMRKASQKLEAIRRADEEASVNTFNDTHRSEVRFNTPKTGTGSGSTKSEPVPVLGSLYQSAQVSSQFFARAEARQLVRSPVTNQQRTQSLSFPHALSGNLQPWIPASAGMTQKLRAEVRAARKPKIDSQEKVMTAIDPNTQP